MIRKVEICGVNTAKLKVLTNDEKLKLLVKIKKGDMKAREEFINGNLRLVLSVIKRFNNRGENMDDLFQIGCIGLIKALNNFDTSYDVRFSTYAVPMILGELRRFLRDDNPIRVSRSMRDMAYKALGVKEELSNKFQREPTVEEIAKHMEVPKENIVFALEAIHTPLSLFEPVYYDGNDAIFVMDQVKDTKNNDENWTEHIALKEAIKTLSERERKILLLRFFAGRTQMEVSKEIGISQAQVSRIEKCALNRMKKQI